VPVSSQKRSGSLPRMALPCTTVSVGGGPAGLVITTTPPLRAVFAPSAGTLSAIRLATTVVRAPPSRATPMPESPGKSSWAGQARVLCRMALAAMVECARGPRAEAEREQPDAVVVHEVAGDPAPAGSGQEDAEAPAGRPVGEHERLRGPGRRDLRVAVVAGHVGAERRAVRGDREQAGAGEAADREAADRDVLDAAPDLAGVEVEVADHADAVHRLVDLGGMEARMGRRDRRRENDGADVGGAASMSAASAATSKLDDRRLIARRPGTPRA
jgi:hypothetical protein